MEKMNETSNGAEKVYRSLGIDRGEQTFTL